MEKQNITLEFDWLVIITPYYLWVFFWRYRWLRNNFFIKNRTGTQASVIVELGEQRVHSASIINYDYNWTFKYNIHTAVATEVNCTSKTLWLCFWAERKAIHWYSPQPQCQPQNNLGRWLWNRSRDSPRGHQRCRPISHSGRPQFICNCPRPGCIQQSSWFHEARLQIKSR